MRTIELNSVDLRFEHRRHKDADVERRLLSSIMERDILDPLQISICKETRRPVLLDGFKRYRCARKLNKNIIPVHSIGEDVVDGVLCLLRRENVSGLSILEQAGMIEELHKKNHLSIHDIARRLERSPSWVSVRLSMIGELSELVRDKIMSGMFPARAYMYGIRVFTRVHKIAPLRVDAFVNAVSGKGLSTRDLSILSKTYFTGGQTIKQLVLEGDPHRVIKMLTGKSGIGSNGEPALTEAQNSVINDLKMIAGGMVRIFENRTAIHKATPLYLECVNNWCATIDKNMNVFSRVIKELHDLSEPADHGTYALRTGNGSQENSAPGTP